MRRNILQTKFYLLSVILSLAACTQDEPAEQGMPLPVGQYPLELAANGLQVMTIPAQSTTRNTFFEGDWDGVTSVKVRVNDQQEKEYSVMPSEDEKTAHLTLAQPFGLNDNLFWWNSTKGEKTVMASSANFCKAVSLKNKRWITRQDKSILSTSLLRRTVWT